jgi:hypothetical protein
MILLLTGCINPNGMTQTSLNNPKERRNQYENAIHYYLKKTHYQIVFTENSDIDISESFNDEIKSGRLECLSFSGNQDKIRGKGYGECEIIQYALDHSRIIRTSTHERIVKITGRLIIKNIKTILQTHQFLFSRSTTFCAINSNLSFTDSRLVVASEAFFRKLLKRKEFVNDSNGVFFEHILYQTIIEEKNIPFSPFIIMPIIEGYSGSTGHEYTNKKVNLSFLIKYLRYTLSLRHKFNNLYRH